MQLHHLHYRSVGSESLEDVLLICDWHHRVATVMEWRCERCGEPIFDDEASAIDHLHFMQEFYPDYFRVADCLKAEQFLMGGFVQCSYCEHVTTKDD